MTHSSRRCGSLLAALVLSGAPCFAAWPAGWTSAPLYGADVRSLAFDPMHADVVFAGTASGQVDVSRDGGSSWTPAGAALPFRGWVVGTLRFDPNRPERLWAGLWGVFGGGMIAWSENGGKTWTTPHAPIASDQVYTLALVPGRLGRIYAGTRAGVLASEDDGATWRLASRNLAELVHVSSLWVDPNRPDRVIAGTWRRAYRSDDGGATWSGIFDGMVLDSEVFTLQSVLGRAEELWASTCGWVYRTEDAGGKWTRHQAGLTERRTPSFAILGGDGGNQRLLAGTVNGAFLSENGGQSFALTSPPDLAISAIAQDPRRPERILLGTEGSGVWRSPDGGRSFVASSRGMTNLRVAATEAFRGALLVAVNHAGPASGLYSSRDGGRSFRDGPDAGLPTVLALARIGDRLLAATEKGLFEGEPGRWTRVAAVGEGRVEQISIDGEHWVVRTAGKLFEGRLSPGAAGAASVGPESTLHEQRSETKLVTRSIARWRGELLASTGQGLKRVTRENVSAVASPEPRLDLVAFPGGVVAWGRSAWLRERPEDPWRELTGAVRRVMPTGDPDRPLLITNDHEALFADVRGLIVERVPLPFAGRDLLTAQRTERGWAFGTSGYGLVLFEPPTSAETAGAAAGAAAAATAITPER